MSINKLKLAAFDFDNTIINVNSDTYINKIIENGNKVKFNSEIENLRDTHGWTERMNAVFEFMFTQHKIGKADYLKCLEEIKIDSSMISLFKVLKQNQYSLIIISDANTIFIETILKNHDILEIFDKIYTNPALFDNKECLKVTPFNQIFNKNGEAFQCSTKICEKNMCKGEILKDYVENYLANNTTIESNEKHIIYVGDGQNDFCPGLFLKESDLFFVRKGFSLERLLNKQNLKEKLISQISFWKDANNILENLQFN